MGIHDAFFKSTFAQPDLARSTLQALLPIDVCSRFDWSTLALEPGSFIDGRELRESPSDLLFSIRTHESEEALVYALFEHQSTIDFLMAFRLLRYIVRIWERWLEQHEGATKLPVVVPIVFYHAPTPWKAPAELASILVPELPQPHFVTLRFALDDLRSLSVEQLAARTLDAYGRLVQMAFWSARSFTRLAEAAPHMQVIASSLRHDPAASLQPQGATNHLFLQGHGATPVAA